MCWLICTEIVNTFFVLLAAKIFGHQDFGSQMLVKTLKDSDQSDHGLQCLSMLIVRYLAIFFSSPELNAQGELL